MLDTRQFKPDVRHFVRAEILSVILVRDVGRIVFIEIRFVTRIGFEAAGESRKTKRNRDKRRCDKPPIVKAESGDVGKTAVETINQSSIRIVLLGHEPSVVVRAFDGRPVGSACHMQKASPAPLDYARIALRSSVLGGVNTRKSMGRLDGKVALISGAARGMGNATARAFAREGAKVVVTDLVDEEGEAFVKELGDAAIYRHLDVTKEDEWQAAVEAATNTFGHLNVLVNNAGTVIPSMMRDLSLEHYRVVTEVNQTGVFLGMKSATAAMEAAGGGSMINISSIDGMIGMDLVFAYVASKWAVRGMTKAAALELAPIGIRVNSIHPGFIHTQLGNANPTEESKASLDRYSARRVPLGRTGEPEDIANLALFLASDESAFSTGSEFVADGGFLAGESLPRGED